ncbi:MAG: hypothetical protein LBV43_02720 [Prevotella sp.]|jgi:hypothetical protein|nr:hypothetical protein [Prevotella sp.]
MELYVILIITGLILFISSLVVWFMSGVINRKNKQQSRKDDKIGGYMFMSSLLVFALALLAYFLL